MNVPTEVFPRSPLRRWNTLFYFADLYTFQVPDGTSGSGPIILRVVLRHHPGDALDHWIFSGLPLGISPPGRDEIRQHHERKGTARSITGKKAW